MIHSTINELTKYVMTTHNKNTMALDITMMMDMSRPSFHEDQPIREVASFLAKKGITGLPVVNSQGEIVGFISEKDCLKNIFEAKLNRMPLGKVKDYMSKEVLCIYTKKSFTEVLSYFSTKAFHVYPVTNNGKYIGLLKRKDVLKFIINYELA